MSSNFSRTWWGQRFLEALERVMDAGRLSRGRSYARNGRVLSYRLERNTVTARVRGSINPYFGVYKEPIYTTTVSMKPIPPDAWKRVIADLSTRASFVARLLMNEMPDTIDDLFAEMGVHLLPHDRPDLITDCSCPDWSNPCKHIAGVYYLLAADLDSDPFLLFELRGLTREHLRHELEQSSLGRILSADLAPREAEIEPATSYYTRPVRQPEATSSYWAFWEGTKRLPQLEPISPPTVPALLVRKQGDYPPFWKKDASFIAAMEQLYERVRSKSPQMKS
jgi:uncharacterized Zn finger protein